MQTYTISKKKHKKTRKEQKKNFKCIFEFDDEVFWPKKWSFEIDMVGF
jgi:hypothetical protein